MREWQPHLDDCQHVEKYLSAHRGFQCLNLSGMLDYFDFFYVTTFYCATIEKIQLQFMLIPNYRYKLRRKNATNKSSAKHYIITQSKCFLDCRQKLRKQHNEFECTSLHNSQSPIANCCK